MSFQVTILKVLAGQPEGYLPLAELRNNVAILISSGLGFSVAQSTVATYMVKRRGSPSEGWRTFLRNHAPDIVAMDLFVVPTIGF